MQLQATIAAKALKRQKKVKPLIKKLTNRKESLRRLRYKASRNRIGRMGHRIRF